MPSFTRLSCFSDVMRNDDAFVVLIFRSLCVVDADNFSLFAKFTDSEVKFALG